MSNFTRLGLTSVGNDGRFDDGIVEGTDAIVEGTAAIAEGNDVIQELVCCIVTGTVRGIFTSAMNKTQYTISNNVVLANGVILETRLVKKKKKKKKWRHG